MFIDWPFSILCQLLYFCFRAPEKKALKFLSSLREETKNNDDNKLNKVPTRLTVVSKTGVMADSRGADLNSKDSSGSIISLSPSLLYLSMFSLVMLIQNYLLNNTQKWDYCRSLRKHIVCYGFVSVTACCQWADEINTAKLANFDLCFPVVHIIC